MEKNLEQDLAEKPQAAQWIFDDLKDDVIKVISVVSPSRVWYAKIFSRNESAEGVNALSGIAGLWVRDQVEDSEGPFLVVKVLCSESMGEFVPKVAVFRPTGNLRYRSLISNSDYFIEVNKSAEMKEFLRQRALKAIDG